ncbi:DUF6503 family protein [Fulvivirga lutimaris]|uniref:DUF6503 family protein n=1 Tax=Fulvivirga lutimaris TaxID=1819566 RepID=UPI0012BB6C87|nr:DUF6503 family protein [Fulvivirga lutimaris]MTI39455.1 hypothetical protein [Fulvivirga lutimaris]
MKKMILTLLVPVFISCQPTSKEENTATTLESTESPQIEYPELLQKALDAHGGLEKWNSYNSLQYQLSSTLGEEKTETQLIDLKSRKVLIKGDSFKLGMDGEQVWVSPNKEAFGTMSARFYHNLIFYFFSIPYVLADPGIQYKDLGTVTLDSTSYRALKVSYNEGVGDADDDFYIAHFNPETFRMEMLLYTVTYFSGEKHENYNALKYDWQQVNGLWLPSGFTGYKYTDGVIGDVRYQSEFTNVILSEEKPDQSLFDMPANSEIDSLKTD